MNEETNCPKCGTHVTSTRSVRITRTKGRRVYGLINLPIGGFFLLIGILYLIILVGMLFTDINKELLVPALFSVPLFTGLGLLLVLPYIRAVKTPAYTCPECKHRWIQRPEKLKVRCPQCGNEKARQQLFYLDPASGEKKAVDELLPVIGGTIFALVLCAYVVIVLISIATSSSCEMEFISLVCSDYPLEISYNLLFVVMGAIGGVSFLLTSGKALLHTLKTSRIPKISERTCLKCKHAWTEGEEIEEHGS
jgi:ssDNA-binding Zn-finger/Zn-ribbon topoisomerase 1